ncbi:hypothetical protein UA32_11900 [Photobacterium angustum]|uniref:hypothetical protein n=1 Tax=Photobacterium angustum TaxID=661 RepID=UPI0005E7155D|nr:hypothetical protein [Photobacterium angustum]KJG37662.1 hypothetical protein UA32_11900 [Photobacterium angustum]
MADFNPRSSNSQAQSRSGLQSMLNSGVADTHKGNSLSRVINIDGNEIKLYRKSFNGEINESGQSDTELFTFPAKENPRASEHLTEESLSHIQNIDVLQLYTAIAYYSPSEDGEDRFAIVDGISRRQKTIYVRAPFHIEYCPDPLTLIQAKKIVEISEQRTNLSPWEKGCYHNNIMLDSGDKQIVHAEKHGISTGELSRVLNLYRADPDLLALFPVPTVIRKKVDVELIGSIEKKIDAKRSELKGFHSRM